MDFLNKMDYGHEDYGGPPPMMIPHTRYDDLAHLSSELEQEKRYRLFSELFKIIHLKICEYFRKIFISIWKIQRRPRMVQLRNGKIHRRTRNIFKGFG